MLKKNFKIFLLALLTSSLIIFLAIFLIKALPNILHPLPKIDVDLSQTTGLEKEESKPLETPSPAEKERAILIDFCPINEKKFYLKFSFKKDKFIVELNPPTEQNYNDFVLWLKNSGFGDIPLDKFEFSNYPL